VRTTFDELESRFRIKLDVRVGLYWKFGQIKKDYHNMLLICDAHDEKYRIKNKNKSYLLQL